MRLDVLLVKRGYFKSRNRAKEAIRRGLVKVNGVVVTKPSADISFESSVEVMADDVPRGYWKLKKIDAVFKIFSGNEVVLDLGSSAGGFLLYTSEKAKEVYGIEFSKEFEEQLKEIADKRKNVKVFIADAFKFDTSKLPEFDVILNDLTLPFTSSMLVLKRFLPKLKATGFVLFVHKTGDGERGRFDELEVVNSIYSEDRKEAYYLLRPKNKAL